MPENITFEQAASICVGILLFVASTYCLEPHGFGFTVPLEGEGGVGKYADQPILIMAGSCSLGQYVMLPKSHSILRTTDMQACVQQSRLQSSPGSPHITTASLHNAEYLQSLGATHVLDRHLSVDALKERIAKLCSGSPLLYAFDAMSLENTQRIAYEALAPGGKPTEVLLQHLPRYDPASNQTVLHALETFEVATPGVREFGQRFMRELSKWLAEGKIKVRMYLFELFIPQLMMVYCADCSRMWWKCSQEG